MTSVLPLLSSFYHHRTKAEQEELEFDSKQKKRRAKINKDF
jgi:hypothetical protein